jgi:hypothetical protein
MYQMRWYRHFGMFPKLAFLFRARFHVAFPSSSPLNTT